MSMDSSSRSKVKGNYQTEMHDIELPSHFQREAIFLNDEL